MTDWLVVVEPAEPAAAEQAFAQWRRDHPTWSARLQSVDIRIDTIRGLGGNTLRAYRVRDLRPR